MAVEVRQLPAGSPDHSAGTAAVTGTTPPAGAVSEWLLGQPAAQGAALPSNGALVHDPYSRATSLFPRALSPIRGRQRPPRFQLRWASARTGARRQPLGRGRAVRAVWVVAAALGAGAPAVVGARDRRHQRPGDGEWRRRFHGHAAVHGDGARLDGVQAEPVPGAAPAHRDAAAARGSQVAHEVPVARTDSCSCFSCRAKSSSRGNASRSLAFAQFVRATIAVRSCSM